MSASAKQAPQGRAIAGVSWYECKPPILDLRGFKCHHWAYAREALPEVIEQMAE